MAAKRVKTKRRGAKPKSIITAADKFIGLTGWWKQFGNLGMAGIVAGFAIYLLTISLPNVQDRFHQELKAERDDARENLQKSREHGNKAAKELGDAIREQSQMMDWHQTMIQTNQASMLEWQQKSFYKK